MIDPIWIKKLSLCTTKNCKAVYKTTVNSVGIHTTLRHKPYFSKGYNFVPD